VRDYKVDSAMVVPSNIIKQDMEGDYVYVVDRDQQAHKVYVETGRSYNNQTVLVSGVNPGDRVITSGYTQVSESTPVAIKEKEDLIR
jgi:multidrug efflux pump subunit AcrA (membrane-fusion protein)